MTDEPLPADGEPVADGSDEDIRIAYIVEQVTTGRSAGDDLMAEAEAVPAGGPGAEPGR